MATNDIHLSVSDNNVSVPLTISNTRNLRTVTPQNGSPYYVGARAYVTQTENGATVTVIDKDGTTTAVIANGTDGTDGADGNGIASIDLTSSVGNVDTYTITYTDGTTDTFEITNGVDGQDGTDGVDGVDGFSPTATVSKVGTTATITITDKDGTTTAEVHDGGASAFVAEFNVTTYADVKDAYDNDAILICTVDDSGNTVVLQLVYFDATNEIFYFAEPNGDGWYWTELSNANGWDDGTRYLASTDVATQLADGLMSALDKQKLDGLSKRNIWYGTCSTSASSSPKAITTASGDFSLTAGNMLVVLFSHANSLSSASLQVDGGASKSAYPMDGTSDISNRWGSNELVMFAYDGTKFIMLEQGKASTTAYGITKLNNTVTSTSTSEAATANAVKSAYDLANGKYTKPSGGIPKTDLDSDVQTSLGLADTALQSFTETDPVFSASAASGISSSDIDNWDGKQDELVSGVSIRTINGTSVLGSGDIEVAAGGTPIPTADTVAEFDSDAHINSEDMSAQDIEDFVDALNVSGGDATLSSSGLSAVSNRVSIQSGGQFKLGKWRFVQLNLKLLTNLSANNYWGVLQGFDAAVSDTVSLSAVIPAKNGGAISAYMTNAGNLALATDNATPSANDIVLVTGWYIAQ